VELVPEIGRGVEPPGVAASFGWLSARLKLFVGPRRKQQTHLNFLDKVGHQSHR